MCLKLLKIKDSYPSYAVIEYITLRDSNEGT